MSKTTVVHVRHSPFDIYIGRGGTYRLSTGWTLMEASDWGNPYRITKTRTRESVIRMYEDWLLRTPELLARLPELRGKRLGCFCAPQPCHGDVLARMADSLPELA